MIIVIDPGHGGADPGAVNGRFQEKDATLSYAQRFEKVFMGSAVEENLIVECQKKWGAAKARGDKTGMVEANLEAERLRAYIRSKKVILTRSGDTSLTRPYNRVQELAHRAAVAKNAKANMFISLHCNSFVNRKVRGFEVHIYPQAPTATVDLAKQVYESLVTIFQFNGSTGRGVKKTNLGVLRYNYLDNPQRPAMLLEMGFTSNDEDLRLILSESFQDWFVANLAKVVKNYK